MSLNQDRTRRDFLKTGAALTGGLIIGFCLPFNGRISEAAARIPAASKTFIPNAFLRITPDDTVTVIIGKSEMGQGVFTSLPMIVAEELDADWHKIRIEEAPVDPAYNHTVFGSQITGGSTSVWSSYDQLRRAGATARMMLIEAAATIWKVPAASCRAEQGVVLHAESGRRLSFGELAHPATRQQPPAAIKLKDPQSFTIIGKPTKRIDSREKVTGKAEFGIDVRRAGMLTALIARPPVFRATLKAFDAAKAKAMPGVKAVFPVSAGVAVVATGFWQAKRGRDALVIDWDTGSGIKVSTPELFEQYTALTEKPGAMAAEKGNFDAAMDSAAVKLEAMYKLPYLAHATMEPLNCTVDYRGRTCEIWTGTQNQTADRAAAARILGLKPEAVKLHTTFLGGGFGRRANTASDFVSCATEVAKVLKKPVKVVYTREDDMRGGYYRSLAVSKLKAALDEKGKPLAWFNRIVVQSIMAGTPFAASMIKNGVDATSVEGAADLPYAVPNLLVDLHSPTPGISVLWWRSVGHSINGFVTESFIDELAHAAGQDPFSYRRMLLADHPRHKAVLELAAKKAGWGSTLPDGVARGIAVHESFKSFVAQVAEVSLEKNGRVKVHRVVCAVDCGSAVNPLTVEAQMQGAIVFGLTAAFYGAITLDKGKVVQSNFDEYRMLRMPEMPGKIEVHIIESGEALGGIGEPGVPPIAPAITNALFALTGKRIRTLPIDPEELKHT